MSVTYRLGSPLRTVDQFAPASVETATRPPLEPAYNTREFALQTWLVVRIPPSVVLTAVQLDPRSVVLKMRYVPRYSVAGSFGSMSNGAKKFTGSVVPGYWASPGAAMGMPFICFEKSPYFS